VINEISEFITTYYVNVFKNKMSDCLERNNIVEPLVEPSIKRTSGLHVYQWDKWWSGNFVIHMLSEQQRKLLYLACEQVVMGPELIRDSVEFKQMWDDIDAYINKVGSVFVKLSSVSPKDVELEDGMGLRNDSVERVFKLLTRSFRIMSELEYNDDDEKEEQQYAIVVRKWDTRIKHDNEYRCLIVDGKLDSMVRMHDEKLLSQHDTNFQTVEEYVRTYGCLLPNVNIALDIAIDEENVYNDSCNNVIFVEFNPLDDELDLYGVNESNMSDRLKQLLS